MTMRIINSDKGVKIYFNYSYRGKWDSARNTYNFVQEISDKIVIKYLINTKIYLL